MKSTITSSNKWRENTPKGLFPPIFWGTARRRHHRPTPRTLSRFPALFSPRRPQKKKIFGPRRLCPIIEGDKTSIIAGDVLLKRPSYQQTKKILLIVAGLSLVGVGAAQGNCNPPCSSPCDSVENYRTCVQDNVEQPTEDLDLSEEGFFSKKEDSASNEPLRYCQIYLRNVNEASTDTPRALFIKSVKENPSTQFTKDNTKDNTKGNIETFLKKVLKARTATKNFPKPFPHADSDGEPKSIDEAKAIIKKDLTLAAKYVFNCEAMIKVMHKYKNPLEKSGIRPDHTASFDGRLTCSQYNVAAIDYVGCSTFANTYSAFFVGKNGLQAIQGAQTQSEGAKLTQNIMNQGTEADPLAGIKAQKDMTETQKDMAHQRLTLDTTKMATLGSILYNIPSANDIIDECSRVAPGAYLTAVNEVAALAGIEKPTNIKIASGCEELLEEGQLLQNQESISKMAALLGEAGVDMLKSTVEAQLLDKQGKLLDGALQRVEEFTPGQGPFADLQQAQCEADPTVAGCAGLGGSAQLSDLGGGINLNFNGGIGSTGGEDGGIDLADSGDNAISDQELKRTPGSIGSPVTEIDKKFGFADSAASPGGVKAGAVPQGGGTGSGSTSAAGIGGKSGDGGAGGEGGPAPYKETKIGYSEGGGLNYAGGKNDGDRSEKKKDFNPFEKLFGKEKKGNKVLNFRDLASVGVGSQNSDLFKRISRRYAVVRDNKRLLDLNRY